MRPTLPDKPPLPEATPHRHARPDAATLPADAAPPSQRREEPADETESPASLASRLPIVDPDSYDVGSEVAQGGIGRVLRAEQRSLDRPVALKELLHAGGDAEERFVREARLIAADAFAHGVTPVLRGHSNGIIRIDISPDGKLVATASDDFTARIWDIEAQIRHLEFSPDSALLARLVTGEAKGSARVWDREGRPLHTWKSEARSPATISFASGTWSAARGARSRRPLRPLTSSSLPFDPAELRARIEAAVPETMGRRPNINR